MHADPHYCKYDNLKFCVFKQDTDGCQFFTYSPLDGACFAYENCPAVDETACPDCVSGQATCDVLQCNQVYICDGDKVFQGNRIPASECADKCLEMDDCEWYSYDSSQDKCTLTSDCPATIACIGTSCKHNQKYCAI